MVHMFRSVWLQDDKHARYMQRTVEKLAVEVKHCIDIYMNWIDRMFFVHLMIV